jgi:L-cysteine S-thiosulfotransferase
MTRISRIALLVALVPFAALADEVAPTDVVFEDGAVEASLSGAPGNPEAGKEVISSRSMGNCVACHMVSDMPDVQFQGDVGPPLDGVGGRWSEAEIRGIVANAKMMYDGTIMPAFYKTSGYVRPGDAYTTRPAEEPLPPLLTAQQIEDVVAYLTTLTH